MTGLPNFHALKERTRTGWPPGEIVAYLDIDHMRDFNDFYGLPMGDNLIQVVASLTSIASGNIWGKASVYRVSGEEFVSCWRNGSLTDAQNKLIAVNSTLQVSESGVSVTAVITRTGIGDTFASVFNRLEELIHPLKVSYPPELDKRGSVLVDPALE